MTRAEAWMFHGSNALVAATGLAYAWTAYVAEPEDPYALVNHPMQPVLQHAHLLVAPLLVFCCGVLWQRHALPRVQSGARARRASGLALVALFVPMALSGYSIQVCVEESWRWAWVVVHLATSAIWALASVAHLLRRARAVAPERAHSSSLESTAASTRG